MTEISTESFISLNIEMRFFSIQIIDENLAFIKL